MVGLKSTLLLKNQNIILQKKATLNAPGQQPKLFVETNKLLNTRSSSQNRFDSPEIAQTQSTITCLGYRIDVTYPELRWTAVWCCW